MDLAFDHTLSRISRQISDAAHEADERAAELAAHEADLRERFLKAARAGVMTDPAYFAPRVTDFSVTPRSLSNKRHLSVGEVMLESLDFTDGPEHDDVLQLLCEVANAGNPKAQALIERMAARWAVANAEAQ